MISVLTQHNVGDVGQFVVDRLLDSPPEEGLQYPVLMQLFEDVGMSTPVIVVVQDALDRAAKVSQQLPCFADRVVIPAPLVR